MQNQFNCLKLGGKHIEAKPDTPVACQISNSNLSFQEFNQHS
jgi:hypothetical protein